MPKATPELESFAGTVGELTRRLSPQAADLLVEALDAADPYPPTRQAVEELGSRGAVCVAAGKAAVPMARAWRDAGGPPGVAVVPEGVDADLPGWEVRWGEHPVPGARSLAAGRRVVDLARQGLPVVLLLSGGASSMLESPALPADEHRRISERLHRLGLPIGEWNAARSLLSELKAGGLAREVERAGADLTVVVVSDVPGDDPALVGSGPGVRVPTETLVDRVGGLPEDLRERIVEAGRDRDLPDRSADHRVALGRDAPVRAARALAEARGLDPEVVCLDGPVEQAAERAASTDGLALLYGEPTVPVPEEAGRGGRATHLLLEIADRAGPGRGVAVVATDGVDGAAGAGGYLRLVGDLPETGRQALERCDSATFLEGLDPEMGGLFPASVTGANSADVGVLVDL